VLDRKEGQTSEELLLETNRIQVEYQTPGVATL